MMRLFAPAVLIAVAGLSASPLIVHAQPTTAKIQHEVEAAWAKYKGAWTQTKGEAKQRWGKLTDNDVEEIDGRREVLIGKLQTRYAISYEEAERQVGDFESRRP